MHPLRLVGKLAAVLVPGVREFRALAGTGVGLVVVSHDHGFVEAVCDQVITLREVVDVV